MEMLLLSSLKASVRTSTIKLTSRTTEFSIRTVADGTKFCHSLNRRVWGGHSASLITIVGAAVIRITSMWAGKRKAILK